ncbi:helix-turn-helix transcriptional regulator [Pseudomonas oryzihabitans]|uniref:helix-turn-helix transcriptional regulator n=1 Tax=Pseudomonas oryzihabitans TaxID=47885 RepID=UPI00285734AE|nr:helix-turn-helix transcriptional regulator [Pseudomonas psychrotolerans]MDR6678918.1 DNA-binding CsgD family transcriptional regulator [Pseudomonas psychrotolerans]
MQRHYDELVRLCYECVLDESRWDALLERLIPLSGRQQGGVMIQAQGRDFVDVSQYHRYNEAVLAPYAAYYHLLDPGRECMPQRAVGHWYHDWRDIGTERIKRDPYYQDYQHPLGLGNNSCVKLYETASTKAYLTLITEVGQRTPDTRQQQLLEQLSPHLRLAGTFASHLAALTRQLHHQSLLLDYSGHCCWLVDGQARLVFASQRGDALLHQPNAPLRVQQDRLRTRHDGVPLGKAIQRAAGIGGPPRASLVKLDEHQRRHLLVIPVAPGLLPNDSPPLVLLTLSERPLDHERARDLFKLTPAETRLALLLMEGLTPEACAIRLKVSITTIRSQLRALLRKTETERQAELVALLGRVAGG